MVANIHYFDSREDATFALELLRDSIREYGYATLYDYYILCGEKSLHELHKRIGWTDLKGSFVRGYDWPPYAGKYSIVFMTNPGPLKQNR